jgi:hypothetical protein
VVRERVKGFRRWESLADATKCNGAGSGKAPGSRQDKDGGWQTAPAAGRTRQGHRRADGVRGEQDKTGAPASGRRARQAGQDKRHRRADGARGKQDKTRGLWGSTKILLAGKQGNRLLREEEREKNNKQQT